MNGFYELEYPTSKLCNSFLTMAMDFPTTTTTAPTTVELDGDDELRCQSVRDKVEIKSWHLLQQQA